MPFFYNKLTPVVFMIVVFSFIAIVVIAVIIAGVIKRKREMEVYKSAIEKGIPLADLKLIKSPLSTLKYGLIWIAVGIGLFTVILVEGSTKNLSVSSIPILIGVALIISYMVEKREDNQY